MFFNFFKKKTTKQTIKSIEYIILEKEDKNSIYLFYLKDFRIGYNNIYLWNYIQRDVVVSILSDFLVYIYTVDESNTELEEDLGELYTCKKSKDGVRYLLCNRIDYRIVTELIEAYSNFWEYGYLVNFTAYSEKAAQFDIEQLENCDQLKGFAINIKPIGDNIGIEILIDPKQISETELIELIQNVTDKYKIELKVIIKKDSE